MAKQSIVPFGPQHPVLPEPVHLDLVLEDEVVVKAVPSIGFVHRGLEKLVETRDYKEYVYIAERVCGICSFGHGMGYCQCLEKIMNVEIPPRAAYLRTIWMEMSRVHSHLLWLGLLAGLACHFAALPAVLRRRTAGAVVPWLLLLGLLGMALLRCAMIAFVEVSSFGIGTSTMYLATVHPLFLLYAFLSLAAYGRSIRRKESGQ